MKELRKPHLSVIQSNRVRLWRCTRFLERGHYVGLSPSLPKAWQVAHAEPLPPTPW